MTKGSSFPRATVKAIVRAHAPGFRQQRNLDILLYLDLLMFLKDLATEADTLAARDKSKVVRKSHVDKALKLSLKRFRA